MITDPKKEQDGKEAGTYLKQQPQDNKAGSCLSLFELPIASLLTWLTV